MVVSYQCEKVKKTQEKRKREEEEKKGGSPITGPQALKMYRERQRQSEMRENVCMCDQECPETEREMTSSRAERQRHGLPGWGLRLMSARRIA